MKSEKISCFIPVVILFLVSGILTPSLKAELLVEEQFDYDLLALIMGQDGGFGFEGPWEAGLSHGRPYDIQFEGLTFIDENSEELNATGNSLSRYGSMGRAQANRLLSADALEALTADNTTIWFGMLVSGPTGHRYGAFHFGSYPFSTQGQPVLGDGDDDRNPPYTPYEEGEGFGLTFAGVGMGDGGGAINALAFDDSATPIIVAGTFTQTLDIQTIPNHYDTSLLVGKINWKPLGEFDELYLFNVVDFLEEPDEADAIASITDVDLEQSLFDRIAVWDTNNVIFDEIRLGTTFFDAIGAEPVVQGPTFLRGDANADDTRNLADAIFILSHLFTNGEDPTCLDTADVNDDGGINLADAIQLLSYMFSQDVNTLDEPFEICGPDPTEDDLDCIAYEPCGT